MQDDLKKVDNLNVYEYKEGVDPESASYKFFNSLNFFRIENKVSINILIYSWKFKYMIILHEK